MLARVAVDRMPPESWDAPRVRQTRGHCLEAREEALAELQELEKRLERGDNKLEEAIKAYERCAALKRHCEATLREAQLKVEKIVLSQDGSVGVEPAKLD